MIRETPKRYVIEFGGGDLKLSNIIMSGNENWGYKVIDLPLMLEYQRGKKIFETDQKESTSYLLARILQRFGHHSGFKTTMIEHLPVGNCLIEVHR